MNLQEAAILERALNGMPGGILVYGADKEGKILYANSWFIHRMGCRDFHDFMETTGGTFQGLLLEEDRERVEEEISRQVSSGASAFDYVNCHIRTKDGRVLTFDEFGHRMELPSGTSVFYAFFPDENARNILHDIDGITGLPGQTRFLSLTARHLSCPHRPGKKECMLYMNIHNFKMFNLLYSSRRGNEFLKRTADILKDAFPGALISRFSDDHFAIFTDRDGVEDRVQEACRQIMGLREDVDLDVKFGLYSMVDHAMKPETACDLAKAASDSIRDNYHCHFREYTEKIGERASIRSYVIDHLQEAIDKKYIKVYLQPVIRSLSGTLSGAEALSRWIDPIHGFLSPADFIPALEESRQIRKLDLYVLEEICRLYQQRVEAGLPMIPVSFNLSRIDFYGNSIFEDVDRVVRKYHVPRHMIHVEITESIFIKDGVTISTQIEQFRNAGYEMWMDDFGSGYSSLNVLKDYHFDEIKIDMAFLSSLSGKARSIIRSTVRMAKEIGIHTLVEGVETEEQMEFIRSIGCEKIQGYFYGRPMDISEFWNHAERNGWIVEDEDLWGYYSPLGSVDFLTDQSMALVEMKERKIHYLFTNDKFREALSSGGTASLTDSEGELNEKASSLAENIRGFFQDILASGESRSITYPENNQYMHLTGHLVSSLKKQDRHLFLIHLSNVTIHESEKESKELDGILRNLFYLYQNITVLNLMEDTATPIISNTPFRRQFHEKMEGIDSLREAFESQIHPDDRGRFRHFVSAAYLHDALRRDPYAAASACFRTLGEDREFHWSVHTVMAVPKKHYQVFLYTFKLSFMNNEDFRNPMMEIARTWESK